METPADRLRRARIAAGFDGPGEAAERFFWNVNTYKSNENGNAPFSFKKAKLYAEAYGVRPEWLYDDAGPMRPAEEKLVPIIGRVGANASGEVLLSTGQPSNEFVPIPPAGTQKAVALLVDGHSMRGIADHGALIYFEDQRTPPTPDMLGQIVIVETDTEEVLIKRLLRGSKKGLYDLESVNGETLQDRRIRWAAHISAIIPAFMARRAIRSGGEAA